MVEVFKTNVQKMRESKKLVNQLNSHFTSSKFNVDIEDCDKVLRVEGKDICAEQIIRLVTSNGFECELME
jgi:hypothetical protein